MALIDPEQERRRLTELYSGQTDGELEQSASHADELTEVAREVLRTEMANRGLRTLIQQQQLNDPGEPEFRDLVTIRSFWSLPEANLAKGVLEVAGIEAFLFDENIVGLGLYITAVQGVTLRVDRRFADEADRILHESTFEPEDSEESDSSGL